ncbi:PAS domain S-box protein [Methylobacter sp.]|uniref:PAS domain S-box protein n=1 Tax=Methylobacter sp. TaxID=2051955 RepID=UPI002FDE6664
MSADSIARPNMMTGWLKQLGIALLYLLLGYVINHHFTNNNVVCTVWPGAGLALAVLLIGGRRYIRGLILGSLALNTLSNDSVWAIGGITLTHTVEALLGVWLLTRNGRSVLSLHTLRDYRRLVISGGVAGIAGAMIGGLSILLAGYITPADYLANVLRWWMGDTLGVVLVTPLMLAWWQEKWEPFKARQPLEALLLSGLSFLVGQIVFMGWFREYLTEAPKGYWLFLCVTWVALRLGNRGVTVVLLMIAVQALTGAYYQIGFFAEEIATANLYNYWAYMLILSVVGMTFAAYVSELKRTLTALQLNSARIQLLLDSSLDGIVSMDHNGNVIGWNAQAEHIFGYSGEQALGRDTAELIVPPAYRERHWQGLSRFMETGVSDIIGTRLEVTGLRADASEFPIEIAVHALKQQDSYFFSAYIRDISKRKQAEAAQQEALDKLHKIARQLPGVVFQFRLRKDGSSCLPYASEVLRDIYRVDPEDVVDDAAKIFAVVHPDDLDGHLASIQTSARDLNPWRNEYRLRFADGTERWLFGNALPQREEDGSVLWHGFVTDITERKQMEEKLRDSDAFNASILNSLTSHITVLDAQGGIIAVNDAWRRFAKENGLPESSRDMLGFNYLDACKNSFNQAYGDEASIAQSGITEVLAGDRKIFHLEYPCHSPTEQRWFQMNVSPLQGSRPGVVISHKNITERKKAEEIAQAASQYARSLIEASLDPLVTISAEGKVTDVNTATEQVTGVNRDSLIGSDFADYFIDPEKAREGYLRVFSQGFVTDYPLAIRHVSGKITDVLYNASVYRDSNGNVLGVFAAARDITKRKQAEESLEMMRFSVDHAGDSIFWINREGRILYVNRAACTERGYSREEMLEMSIFELDPDYQPGVWGPHFEDLKRRGTITLKTRHRTKDGYLYPIEVNANYVHIGGHEFNFCFLRDITARNLMEDELKASEAKFRSIIEASPVPMALNNGQLNITFLNQAFVQTFGYNVDDIPTLADWSLKAYPDPNYRHWVTQTWQAALEQAERECRSFLPMEINICSKDGAFKTVLASAAVIVDSFKDEHLVVLYDITERKQAELAKHRSEEQLRAFYELDLVGLTITSPEKGWIRINECLCRMLEYSEQTLRQMTWAELTHPEDLAADVEQFERLLANEINGYALEKRFVSRTGKVIPTKLVVRGLRKASGELDYVMAMVEDITEYKRAETELKRSNAELEQFAYAVSHDMRQPLRMVSSYLSLIENALAGQLNEETQQFLNFAREGAKRMDAMILSLLDYSRIGRKFEAKTWISSKASLDEALAFLKPELSACGGEIKVTGDWPELFASRDELTRLLQNLVGNALKYHEEDQPPQVDIHGTIHAGSLRVEVRDHGIGIEPSQVNRLFKVFSRLQARSRFEGTGVGLALCRKIVEHHGGGIGVESAGEGQGCLFWFELPLVNAVNPE